MKIGICQWAGGHSGKGLKTQLQLRSVKDPLKREISQRRFITVVGEQNLPPRSAFLGCELFQVENNQGPKDSGRIFDLLPNCIKNVDRGPVPGRELLP